MSKLSLYLLGPPRVELNGGPIQVDTRKATALLAYIAVNGDSYRRDHLATLFWSEYDQSRARAALRRTLSVLKKALAGDWLVVDREEVSLADQAGFWMDVGAFKELLERSDQHGHPADDPCEGCLSLLSEAINLYRDDFLTGFTLRDSPNFDDWQFFETETLRRALAGALEKLVKGISHQGRFQGAIDYARRWSALDLLHEEPHRQLMRLYTWAGQRSAGLRQYRECVRVLDQELGVTPLEETTELYQRILENQLSPPPSKGKEAASSVVEKVDISAEEQNAPDGVGFPLVGRSSAWEFLTNSYTTMGEDGRFLVVEGEAGIGKTRLALEFLGYVQERGGRVLSMRSFEGETDLAYGPFIEGLQSTFDPDREVEWLDKLPVSSLSEALRLFPELEQLRPHLPEASPLEGPGAQSRFLDGLRNVVIGFCAGPSPGIIFLDDAHWCDEASLDLLSYLIRRLRKHPVIVFVTWRSEEVSFDHRLRPLLGEAKRLGMGGSRTLLRLEQESVAELVRSIIQEADTDLITNRLFEETEGLPFFVVAYLSMIAKRKEIVAGMDWSRPGGVRDLLQARLSNVEETQRQLLSAGAVIGRSFEDEILRLASGRSEEETVTGLEALVRQGLIVEVRGREQDRFSRYDFSHNQLRSLVYEETSLVRRRLLHRRVGETLLSRYRTIHEVDAVAGQIAQHFQMAGRDLEAAEFYYRAAEHARKLFANAEAVSHFQRAIAFGHPDVSELHEAIGDVHTLRGKYRSALSSYEAAVALNEIETEPRLEHKLGAIRHRLGEWEIAAGHYQTALGELGSSGSLDLRARVFVDWSLTAHRQRNDGRAAELANQALEMVEEVDELRTRAQIYNLHGILARSRGDLARAADHFTESLALAQEWNDLSAQIAALNNLALVQADRGEVERAKVLYEDALTLCEKQGDRHREAALHNNLADILQNEGRPEKAMVHLKQAVTIFAEIGQEFDEMQPEIWKLVEW
jgi:predicted ATPase/DNA-binding SARP family transcriptional activator